MIDENDKLLGMISPRDLLRVFLRPDAEIRLEIISGVLTGYLGINPALVPVDFIDGELRANGTIAGTLVPRRSGPSALWVPAPGGQARAIIYCTCRAGRFAA